MKTISAFALFASLQTLLAASFQNLGFEEPQIVPTNPIAGELPELLIPGWANPNFVVGFNYTQAFVGFPSLVNEDFRDTHFGQNTKVAVVGEYSLAIWPGSTPISPDGSTRPFTLRQTGDIPDDAQSLRFFYHGSDLHVFVAGVEQHAHRLEDQPATDPEIGPLHYFTVDVSPYAGQTTELRFLFYSRGYDDFGDIPRRPFEPNAQMHVIDDLSFSPLPAVPEPQTWALLGIGLSALLWWSRRR